MRDVQRAELLHCCHSVGHDPFGAKVFEEHRAARAGTCLAFRLCAPLSCLALFAVGNALLGLGNFFVSAAVAAQPILAHWEVPIGNLLDCCLVGAGGGPGDHE